MRFTVNPFPNGWWEVYDTEQAISYDYYRTELYAREVAQQLNRHVKPKKYVTHPIKSALHRAFSNTRKR